MRIPRLFRFLIPLTLLFTSVQAEAATESFVLDPSIVLTMDVTKDTPLVCAVSLLHNLERATAKQEFSMAVIDEYAARAKLDAAGKAHLTRDCMMFNMGVVFEAKMAASTSGSAAPSDDSAKDVPGFNNTNEKR